MRPVQKRAYQRRGEDRLDFAKEDTTTGSYPRNAPLAFDVTDLVAAAYTAASAGNTDCTYDFRFALTTNDGIIRLNPEEFADANADVLELDSL